MRLLGGRLLDRVHDRRRPAAVGPPGEVGVTPRVPGRARDAEAAAEPGDGRRALGADYLEVREPG